MFGVINAVRSLMCDAGVDPLDGGAGEPTLSIETAGDAPLLVIGLNATAAFGAAVNGVATAANPTTGGGDWSAFSQLPTASGVAGKAKWIDGDGTVLYESTISTVAAGTGEVQFDTLTFDTAVAATTTVSPTITMPAS